MEGGARIAQSTSLPAMPELSPAEWQVTSYCFLCDLAKNLVVLMVYSDWRAKCVYYEKYGNLENEKGKSNRLNNCAGLSCHYVTDYRDKLIQEVATN